MEYYTEVLTQKQGSIKRNSDFFRALLIVNTSLLGAVSFTSGFIFMLNRLVSVNLLVLSLTLLFSVVTVFLTFFRENTLAVMTDKEKKAFLIFCNVLSVALLLHVEFFLVNIFVNLNYLR